MTAAFAPLYLCASTIDDADLDTRIAAAVAAGYAGIGLRPGHLARALAGGGTVADVRAKLADAGLELVEIGFLAEWWHGDDVRAARTLEHERALHRLKDEVGGRHVMVIGGPLEQPLDVVAERFAGVCDRAAEHGLVVGLEFLPWTDTDSAVRAWDVVRTAGRPNAGIVLDTWHHVRGSRTLTDLDAVPPERVVAVQLSDGPLAPVGTELEDTFRRRQLPGHGEFDLTTLLRRVLELGVRAPLGVEVLSDELRARSPQVAAAAAADATRALLERVGTR
ncbi:sugar phosphate isomerase/epimerase family protein [Blastococcus sp. SYSU DS0533]